MAVFLSNICKFNSCGIKFASLPELIRHIEDHHLDTDTLLDSYPTSYLPVSKVMRIFSSQNDDISSIETSSLHDSHARKSINSPAASLSTTPTEGSEFDEDGEFESDSGQSSIDSWANVESVNNPLMKFHHIMGSNVSSPTIESLSMNPKLNRKSNDEKRVYVCNVNGCNKQYRNSNSMSHHRRSAHKISGITYPKTPIPNKAIIDESGNKKMYKCFCGKTYKTSHGWKNHCNNHHCNIIQVPQSEDKNFNESSLNAAIIQPRQNSMKEIKQEIDNHNQSSQLNQILQTNPSILIKSEIISGSKIDTSPTNSFGQDASTKIGSIFSSSDIISDNNCPPVSVNVEIKSEQPQQQSPTFKTFLKTSPPIISAPTLQQHLLSPIIPKVANV